jgi:hypothetical protein
MYLIVKPIIHELEKEPQAHGSLWFACWIYRLWKLLLGPTSNWGTYRCNSMAGSLTPNDECQRVRELTVYRQSLDLRHPRCVGNTKVQCQEVKNTTSLLSVIILLIERHVSAHSEAIIMFNKC